MLGRKEKGLEPRVLEVFDCQEHTWTAVPNKDQQKNAPHFCEAFGAENDRLTVSCTAFIVSALRENAFAEV